LKKRCLFICALCAIIFALAGPAVASDTYTILTYNMAQPLGELEDFTSDFSFRGWSFAYRNFIRDRLSLGFCVSWQGFSQKESGTYTAGPITATGTQIRYVNSIPIMATGYVYTGDPGGFRLYGGLGAGTFYIQDRFDFGLYTFYEDHWHFGLVPEAGVMFPLGSSPWNLLGNVTYNYAFGTKNYRASSYVAFNVGFAFEN